MRRHTEFFESLKVGDQVAFVEGGLTDDPILSRVVSITSEGIQIELYPGLRFVRHNGNQLPGRGGGIRKYRLASPNEFQIQKEQDTYKENLVKLLDEHTLTPDQFNRCYSTLEEILNE